MAKRRIDMSEQPGAGGFSNPFTSLQEDLPDLPRPTPATQGDPGEGKPLPPQLVRQRAVVRLERKGHGGKTVTRISEMARSEEDAAACLAHLRKQLGCGGTTDGQDILLQGDQCVQVESLLFGLGVKRVFFG